MIKNSKIKAAVLALVAIALIVLVVIDIFNIKSKNEETSALLIVADESVKEKILVQSAREFMNNAKGEILAFEGFVLSDEDLVATIEKIENAGERLGLEANIASVEKMSDGGKTSNVSFIVETEGGWNGTFAYLKALEALPNRVIFDEVHLRKEEGIWVSRIGISLYNFK